MRIHEASLRSQIAALVAAVALVPSLFAWAVAHASAGASAHASSGELFFGIEHGVLPVVIAVVTGSVLAALGAALALYGSIMRTVEDMRLATESIRRGRFDHRIGSRRADQLGELARGIDDAAARLGLLENSRREFLASISHELRTPLTVIRGHAFTMSRSETDTRRLDRLRIIDVEVDRLSTLVDDLLTAATIRVQPIQLRRECVPVADLVQSACDRFRPHADQRGVGLEVRAPSTKFDVSADPGRVHQLLGNLLGNAVRHADPASVVVVSVVPHRAGARIRVTNVGEPIPPAVAARALEPFVQGPSPGSAGLGLAVARELAEAHGGALQLRTRGRATTFEFVLAAAASQRQAATPVRARFAQ